MVEVNALREMPKSSTIDSRSAGILRGYPERSAHVLLVDEEFGELRQYVKPPRQSRG